MIEVQRKLIKAVKLTGIYHIKLNCGRKLGTFVIHNNSRRRRGAARFMESKLYANSYQVLLPRWILKEARSLEHHHLSLLNFKNSIASINKLWTFFIPAPPRREVDAFTCDERGPWVFSERFIRSSVGPIAVISNGRWYFRGPGIWRFFRGTLGSKRVYEAWLSA